MKFLALFALFAVALGAKSGAELENYTYEQFVEDFGLKYSATEAPKRRELFNLELARVKAHNAKGLSWTEGINKYSAMTKAEKSGLFGRSKSVKAATERSSLKYAYEVPDDFEMVDVSALPPQVDWRKKGIISAVKDQGHCGSCWAFASTATIESHVALSTGLLFDLSPEQIAMCAPNPNSCGGTGGCEGATSEIAFEYIASTAGQFEEFQYPYISYFGQDYPCNPPNNTAPKAKIGGYVKLPENNYTALMNAVAHRGPIAISVDASSWSSYHGGIYDGCNQANPDIDHAVQLVGYGEDNGQKYWLVRNSWSASWGEAGYIRLARSDSDQTKCGTDTTPQDGSACTGQTQPVKVCGTCGILYDSSFPTKGSVQATDCFIGSVEDCTEVVGDVVR